MSVMKESSARQPAKFEVIRPVEYTSARRTVVVLGAPRGGTSMLAGVLEKLGVFMGDGLGYQKEDRRFRKETPLKTKVQAIFDNNAEHLVWGWKLPNTVYYYDSVYHHLLNPVFVSIYRNPFNVAVSAARRDNDEGRLDELLRVPINHYRRMHNLLRIHSGVPLAACSFDAINSGPEKADFINQLVAFLNIEVEESKRAEAVRSIDYEKGY